MWVLPSRGRPQNIRRLIAACEEITGPSSFFLRLDEDDPAVHHYPPVPLNWIVRVEERVPLSEIYNDFLATFPFLSWYGFIADDVVPETPMWDSKLIDVAGDDGMAVPAGGHDPDGTPHFVLGGDLVRDVGFLSLDGLDRTYIDTVWGDIARERGVLRRVPEVQLTHRHFSTGALMDRTYLKRNKKRDREIYEKWRARRP